MEMWVIAVFLGLSLASFLTAKIASALDMSDKRFFRLGVLSCVAAGAPFIYMIILEMRKDPTVLAWWGGCILGCFVFDLFAAFTWEGDVIPP